MTTDPANPFELERFVVAQEEDDTYDRALGEVQRGRKASHWMWFVYPQIAGLGDSPMSRRYAISGIDEARAYLAHPILGPRLRACAGAAAEIEPGRVERAFGPIDSIKLRSSMTLFEVADPDEPAFAAVLERHFAGERDPSTLRALAAARVSPSIGADIERSGAAMTGRVVHFEVPYDDADRARAFYADVFGWSIQPVPEFEYNFVQTGPTEENGMPAEPGFIGGGMFQRQEDVGRPIITIDVDDMIAAIAAVAAHGGAAVGEPQPVGDMGIAAYFTDSEGNLMGLWQTLGTG